MKHLLLLFISVPLTLLSCSAPEFPKYSDLGTLRILALVVNNSYITPGTASVSLTPYLSDINGSGPVTVTITSCLDPGISGGAIPDCTHGTYVGTPSTTTVTAAGGAAAGVFGTPERTGAPSTGAITVPLADTTNLLSSYSSTLQFNGVPLLVTVTVSSSSGTVRGFRQIYVSNASTNANPALSDLLANGASLTSLPTADANLSSTTSSTPETYAYMTASGAVLPITERFSTTWFVSDGSLEETSVTYDGGFTEWTVPTVAPTGRQTVVVGVLRDGRGGESVLVKKF